MRYSARNYATVFTFFPVELYLPDKSTITKLLEEAKNGRPPGVAPVAEEELSARRIRPVSPSGTSHRPNLSDAGNTALEALFDPLLQRHHGDRAILARTKQAKLDHTTLLNEAQKLDIPAICLERGAYRLQDTLDLRLNSVRHENASVIDCFKPVKNLGVFTTRVNRKTIYLQGAKTCGTLAFWA